MAFGVEKSLVHSVFLILQGTSLADVMADTTKHFMQTILCHIMLDETSAAR
jgi:hypothetical protein